MLKSSQYNGIFTELLNSCSHNGLSTVIICMIEKRLQVKDVNKNMEIYEILMFGVLGYILNVR